MGKPIITGNNLINILYDELCKNEKIELKDFNLICHLETNYIYLSNEDKDINLEVIYMKKVKFKKIDKEEELWVCNDSLSMLLFNKEKFIYYLESKLLVKNLKEDPFTVKIISELSELNFAIKNDYVIYSSDSEYFEISIFREEFNKRKENKKMVDYLTGIDSYNFESILWPERVKFLRGNIGLNGIISSNNDKFQYYLHNSRIGISLEILRIIDISINKKTNNKFLYFNVNIILHESSKFILEKYMAHYLTKLFDNYDDFENFYIKLKKNIFQKNCSRIMFIYEIIKFIIENLDISDNKLYFIFDDIYDYEYCFNMAEIYHKMGEKFPDKKIYFLFFVSLNFTNLDLFKIKKKDYKFRFINNDKEIDPDFYIRTLDGVDSYKDNLEASIKSDLEYFLENKTKFEKLEFLLRMKYIQLLLKHDSNYENFEKILKKFLKYLHITCSGENLEIKKIDFKNNIIKNLFSDKFNSLICDIVNTNDIKIFDILINKCVEGILLEKQIILSLIAQGSFEKLKIDKIFCASKFPENIQFKYGEKIIIIQLLDNSPLYDFGIITFYKNELILKIYQVGINKENYALIKLDEDIIQFDLEYFIKLLKIKYEINIKKYVFGIITSRTGYELNINNKNIEENNPELNDTIFMNDNEEENTDYGENLNKNYKNYKNMKKYCDEHNYEFIIFDRNSKESFLHGNNNNLIPFNFIDDAQEKCIRSIKNIYDLCDFNNLKKSYIRKGDLFRKEEIKSLIKENFSIKYIAKFQTKNKAIPEVRRDNIYLCFYNSKNNFCVKNPDGLIFSNSELSEDSDYESDKFIGIKIIIENKVSSNKSENELLSRKRKTIHQ